jgi:hypothetical protein
MTGLFRGELPENSLANAGFLRRPCRADQRHYMMAAMRLIRAGRRGALTM